MGARAKAPEDQPPQDSRDPDGRRLAALLDHAPVAIAEIDSDGRFRFANERCCALTGYRREELLVGVRLVDLLRAADGAEDDATFARCSRAGLPLEGEYWLVRKDDTAIPVSIALSASHAEEGEGGMLIVALGDLTGRERDDAALRASEGRFRALFENIDQGYCLIEILYNADGLAIDYRFEEVNATFERHTGLHGAVGKTARELVPNLEDHWVETYARVAQTGVPYRFEQVSAAMGRRFAVEAVRAGEPGSRRVALLFADITERRRAEEELRENARRDAFRAALSDTLRALADPDAIEAEAIRLLGQLLGVSRAFYAGAEPDGQHVVIGRDYHAGVPSATGRYRLEDFGTALAAELRAGRTVAVDDIEAEGTLGDADRAAYAAIAVRAHATICLVKGERLAAILGVHQSTPRAWTVADIALMGETAERIWAAVERARAEAALRASEARLQQLADAMPQLVWSADADGTVRYVNRRAQEFDAPVPGDGEIWAWEAGIHPDDRPATLAAWRRSVDQLLPYAHEHRLRMADGDLRWHLSRAVPIRDADGAVRIWYGTTTDIHDLKGAAAERQALIDALAHDLKNPLAALKGQTQVLLRRLQRGIVPSDEALIERIAGFERLAERMATLLSELSENARAMPGEEHGPAQQATDLVALTRDCVDDARQGEGTQTIDLTSDGAALIGDWPPDRLVRVVGNLLDNALKYSPAGSTVAVELGREGDEAVLRVRDAGIGIPAADLPHIFASRRRGGNVGEIAGSGVGLASCKRIVEGHGGTIVAESAEGQGTTMTVRLPLLAAPPD